MKPIRYTAAAAAALVAIALGAPVVRAQDTNTLLELVRTDVRTEKKAIVAENLHMTDAQSAAFWEVYKKYEFDIAKVYDERVAILKDYASQVDSLTDKQAEELAKRSFKAESNATSIKHKYYKEFSKAVGPKIAGHFFQIENTLLRVIDLQAGLLGLQIGAMSKQ